MIEHELKKLKYIKVSEQKKQVDFLEMSKKRPTQRYFVWKELGITLAIVAILVLLVSSYVMQEKLTTASTEVAQIEKIYFSNTKIMENQIPHSTFYPLVEKYSGEELNEINKVLANAKWGYIGSKPGDYIIYKFVDVNGLERVMHYYYDDEKEYLIDPTVHFGYTVDAEDSKQSFQSTFLRAMMDKNVQQKKIIALLSFAAPVIIFGFFKNYRYRKEMGIQKNPKAYSTRIQQFVPTVVLIILFGCMYFIGNVHYIWWGIGLAIVPILFQLLDDRSEHYKWRIQNMWLGSLVMLIVITTIFYYFIY